MLAYLIITEATFKIAGGIIPLPGGAGYTNGKAPAAETRGENGGSNTGETNAGETSAEESGSNKLAIYPVAIPLLAGPLAIMSVIVVNAGFAGALANTLKVYAALLAALAATDVILCLIVVAEGGWLNERITMVFSRIIAIIMGGLSVRYVMDGLTANGIFTSVNG